MAQDWRAGAQRNRAPSRSARYSLRGQSLRGTGGDDAARRFAFCRQQHAGARPRYVLPGRRRRDPLHGQPRRQRYRRGAVERARGGSARRRTVGAGLGDLSFYHDSNGLLAAKLHRLRATIVLLNNNGGGIFSFLPQAAYPEHFEQLFGTPHGLDFSRFAAAYGAGFTRIATWNEFRCAARAALSAEGVQIIEVPTERASNVRLHREVWESVASAVRAAVLSSN